MAKKTDSELLQVISQEVQNSLGYYTSDLSEQRQQSLKYYLGEPYGNEVEGRSAVVTQELLETVEKEFGLLPTPTQDSAVERQTKYKQGGTPLPMAVRLLPTPTVGCEEGGEQSDRVEISKTGSFLLRKKNSNAKHKTFGAKLSDAMLFLEKPKTGGKLNPNFVEFLMGFPTDWTKIEQEE